FLSVCDLLIFHYRFDHDSVGDRTKYFFFFQAEDGIRDFHVTGVQTCALPISLAAHTFVGAAERDGRTLIAVVLGAEGRAEPGAAALFDWAFNAPDITPVGHLVTAEEVDAMIREAEQDGDVLGRTPFDDYGEALRAPGGNSDGVPQVVWVSLVAAAVLGGAGFAVRRLSPRRPGGRYAPRR